MIASRCFSNLNICGSEQNVKSGFKKKYLKTLGCYEKLVFYQEVVNMKKNVLQKHWKMEAAIMNHDKVEHKVAAGNWKTITALDLTWLLISTLFYGTQSSSILSSSCSFSCEELIKEDWCFLPWIVLAIHCLQNILDYPVIGFNHQFHLCRDSYKLHKTLRTGALGLTITGSTVITLSLIHSIG